MCHDEANNAECNFDSGDCCGPNVNKAHCTECKCHEFWKCGDLVTLVGNGFCNDETNIVDCDYDGGDCCGQCVITEFCSTCACLTGAIGVNNPLVGNGVCNDRTNNADCNYDGGDCCQSNLVIDDCSECACHYQETCEAGFFPGLVGNGYCNDATNIEVCNFDGGDCCGICPNTVNCTECACLGGVVNIWIDNNHLVANGVCDDVMNNEICDYDGGDCKFLKLHGTHQTQLRVL